MFANLMLCSLAVAVPAADAATGGGTASAPADQTTQPQQPPADSQQPAPGSAPASGPGTGGSAYSPTASLPTRPTVPGIRARIVHGVAYAPADAPVAVQKLIWSANRIIGLPYIYGGGHQAYRASGYDCSGTVSYALHGAHLLGPTPMDSSELEGFGQSGAGQWVTIFANGGHTYLNVAGIRLDTSAAEDPSGLQGPRWRPQRHDNHGYRVRHPVGL